MLYVPDCNWKQLPKEGSTCERKSLEREKELWDNSKSQRNQETERDTHRDGERERKKKNPSALEMGDMKRSSTSEK